MEPLRDRRGEPPASAPAQEQKPKLDLSKLDPPADLEECSVEEITIDGICGVY
jgi:mycofactocin precursor